METKNNDTKTVEELVMSKLRKNLKFLNYRTAFDKCENGSIENILKQTIKSFGIGAAVRLVIVALSSVFQAKQIMKNPSKLVEKILDVTNIKFPAFLGSLTLIMKSLVLILRTIREKDDGYNSFLSGLIAGYFSLFFIGSKKRLIALLFLTRAIQSISY